MLLDEKGFVWEVLQRYHTDDYLYYVIRNVLTNEERTETSWKIEEKYLDIPVRS